VAAEVEVEDQMNPKQALILTLGLSFLILAVELTGGLIFRSTALIADALHIITDILAVTFSLAALTVSTRPPTSMSTYGFHRIEVIAGLANGLSLMGIVVVIMYTAYERLLHPQVIDPLGTAIFAALALGLNLIASRFLKGAQSSFPAHKRDLNVQSVEMHILGDALASLAVIAGAIAVTLTGYQILDPLVAVFIGLLVLKSAVTTTLEGGAILLERSPIEDMEALKTSLQSVRGVSDIHDFHVWRIDSHITVASLHVCLEPSLPRDRSSKVRQELQNKLTEEGIQHVTIQLEEGQECCLPSHGHEELAQ
jgi:cobalt-zinc-cadmium efflux system protein